MDVPAVQYLREPRGAIAYQRFGEGARTIVWSGPPLISIETRWERPGSFRLWEFLASLGQVVLFDYRGFGVSEHLPLDRIGNLDELTSDLNSVIEHLGGDTVVLIATGVSTIAAVTFLSQRPRAVDRLVLLNATAIEANRREEDVETAARSTSERWGTGEVIAESVHFGADNGARCFAARVERTGATPAVVEAYVRAMRRHDVTPLLSRIEVPTLVVHTGDATHISAEMSQAVAAGISHATFLVRSSSFFNWGEWDHDIKQFITGVADTGSGDRELVTVVFTDIVDSTAHAARVGDAAWRRTLGHVDTFVQGEVDALRGRVVKQTGDGHLIEFGRPGDALAAATRLAAGMPEFGVALRVGIHFGEVERRTNGDLGGIAVHLAARICSQAGPGEILVSRTVAELTAGDGRTYVDRGSPELKGVPGTWQLLALVRESRPAS